MKNKLWKNLAILISMIGLSHIVSLFLPWYAIIFSIALITAIFKLKLGKAILFGFISIFLLWLLTSTLIDFENEHNLSTKIGELFGGVSTFIVILITSIIGGITGLLGGWIGGSVQKIRAS